VILFHITGSSDMYESALTYIQIDFFFFLNDLLLLLLLSDILAESAPAAAVDSFRVSILIESIYKQLSIILIKVIYTF